MLPGPQPLTLHATIQARPPRPLCRVPARPPPAITRTQASPSCAPGTLSGACTWSTKWPPQQPHESLLTYRPEKAGVGKRGTAWAPQTGRMRAGVPGAGAEPPHTYTHTHAHVQTHAHTHTHTCTTPRASCFRLSVTYSSCPVSRHVSPGSHRPRPWGLMPDALPLPPVPQDCVRDLWWPRTRSCGHTSRLLLRRPAPAWQPWGPWPPTRPCVSQAQSGLFSFLSRKYLLVSFFVSTSRRPCTF